MKLLLDENLSPRLPGRLKELFGEVIHVREVGLKQAADLEIWRWANENGNTVVSTDADFVRSVSQFGDPPKLLQPVRCHRLSVWEIET